MRATEKMKGRELHRESMRFDSIYICSSTFSCAQLAAGATCHLVEAVLSGEVRGQLPVGKDLVNWESWRGREV